jgi:hypothetical protein
MSVRPAWPAIINASRFFPSHKDAKAMATVPRSIVSAFFFISMSQAAYADPPKGWKAHELSPAEEKRWIDAVKNHKTSDGATVMEVLKYAEQMRPRRFKLGTIDVGYGGATGEPDGVGIGYFIGMKRLDGDSYTDLWYDIKLNGKEISVIVPKNPVTDDTPINSLEGGRDSFLLKIDQLYKDDCIDFETHAKLC